VELLWLIFIVYQINPKLPKLEEFSFSFFRDSLSGLLLNI